MSEIADLLELLHGARSRFERLHGEFLTWRHDERAEEAFEAHAEDSKGTIVRLHAAELELAEDESDQPDGAESEGVIRIWIDGADRRREESQDPDGGPEINVRAGSRWWAQSQYTGAVTGEVDESLEADDGPLDAMLDPAGVVALLEFELLGHGERAGRKVMRVRARPRPTIPASQEWDLEELGEGADEYELEVDAERGVLLRVEARRGGLPFSIMEATKVEFDEPIAPEVFTFEPPAGEPVRSAEEAYGRNQFDLPIDQAAKRAPFPVLIPSSVPEGWQLTVTFVDASVIQPHQTVVLDYRSKDATAGLMMLETAADAPSELGEGSGVPPLEGIVRDGIQMQARSRTDEWSENQLHFVREPTAITMTSRQLDVDGLAALAVGLVPAPEAPPRLAAE